MNPILETGLACVAPPFVVMVVCSIIVGLILLIDRKVVKD
jgi:hypothetical protein